jgi:hypothetical protein
MRRLLLTLVFACWASPAWAAIAVVTTGNNGNDNGGTTTSVTSSFDAVGAGCANCALVVQLEGDTTTDDVTGCTYNGTAMTFQNKAYAGGAGRWTYTYGLISPAGGGAHDIVCSASSTHYLFLTAISYSGVSGFGATATATVLSTDQITGTITTTTNNSWVYAGVSSSGAFPWAGVTNAVFRGNYAPFDSPAIFDNNIAIAAGGYSMTVDDGPASDQAMVLVELLSAAGGGGGGTSKGLTTLGVGDL